MYRRDVSRFYQRGANIAISRDVADKSAIFVTLQCSKGWEPPQSFETQSKANKNQSLSTKPKGLASDHARPFSAYMHENLSHKSQILVAALDIPPPIENR